MNLRPEAVVYHCALDAENCVGAARICAYNAQMRAIKIGDLCELSGYSRDQMRGLLAELPRFANRQAEARVARVYTNHDALLLVLLCRLETKYGLKRNIVASLCEPIAAALAMPRAVSGQSRLVVLIESQACKYVDGSPTVDDGLVVALGPIFLAIDSYLLPTPLIQRDVGLSATVRKSANTVAARRQGPKVHEVSQGGRKMRRSHG